VKKATALLLAALLSPTIAAGESVISLLTPSPISIFLTIGKWIKSEEGESFEVEVRVSANNLQQAKEEAFKKAITQSLGSLTVSNTEIQNRDVVINEIITASSGYVTDYQITEHTKTKTGVSVDVIVWVSKTRIENRFLSNPSQGSKIDGEKLATLRETYEDQKMDLQKMFSSLFRDFEKQSMDFVVEKSQYERDGILTVTFDLGWNQNFLNSLNETVEKLSPNDSLQGKTLQIKTENELLGNYHFYGKDIHQILAHEFSQRIHTKYDKSYAVLEADFGHAKDCFVVSLEPLMQMDENQIKLNGNRHITYAYKIHMDIEEIRKTKSVEIRLPEGKCE